MTTNDITGDALRTKPATDAYRDGYSGITKECPDCGKKTTMGTIHTCSPQVRPKGGMCQSCEHLHDDCSTLEFSAMRVIGSDKDGTQVVKCAAFAKPNPDWPAEAEARMDIVGQNGNTGEHYEVKS